MTLVICGVNFLFRYAYHVSKDRAREVIISEVVRLLKAERERQGISANEIAQRSGLSQSTISLFERNLRGPTLDTLLRISEALEADLGKILIRARQSAKVNLRESN